MMRFLQWLHRWTSLIILIQIVLWIVSGFYFSLTGHHAMSGNQYHHMDHTPNPLVNNSNVSQTDLMTRFSHIEAIELRSILNIPQFVVNSKSGQHYIDGQTGNVWQTTPELAAKIAFASYSGPGQLINVERVDGSSEVVEWDASGYKVNIDDDLNTRIYVDADSGEVVAHRNSPWVLADWAFKLHFMDYSGERSFNHLLIVTAGIVTLWFSLSGLILLCRNLARGDLNPVRKPTYLEHFQKTGQPIASACGGGGTCGLCKVQFFDHPPKVSELDRQHLTIRELDQGFRLSCQHRTNGKSKVHLSDNGPQEHSLQLVKSRPLTPNIFELTFRNQSDTQFAYQAGQFMQFIIPSEKLKSDWGVRRNYSFSTAPGDQELVFNVRKMVSPNEGIPPGFGSTYLCEMAAGDTINAIGPMGDFILNDDSPSHTAQIFIGGGAGIAPLRALIQSELKKATPRPIYFFYGARSESELCYLDEFRNLAQQSLVEYIPVVSDDVSGWSGEVGFVHDVARKFLREQNLENIDCYVCGPPPMLVATRNMLAALGVAEKQVRYDDFGI
ncbi:PepSY domain-containing protein [Pseudidiomarina aestuarii]|uniref:PepSY domain-containing protein n=1 Tax=Pseudidiomarina aestuarii TaxID=624146 RepID=UPI003A97949A